MTLSSTSLQADRLVVLDDKRCRLSGDWNVQALAISGETQRRLALLARVQPSMGWDLTAITKLAAVGAQLLWKRRGAKFVRPGTTSGYQHPAWRDFWTLPTDERVRRIAAAQYPTEAA